jgi:hypothetical protein
MNIDHRVIHDAVNTACRSTPGHPVRTLLYFEVPSSTEWQIPGSAPVFAPTWFVDISATLDAKLAALHEYQTEMRDWPHPRSYKAVEHLRAGAARPSVPMQRKASSSAVWSGSDTRRDGDDAEATVVSASSRAFQASPCCSSQCDGTVHHACLSRNTTLPVVTLRRQGTARVTWT